MQKAIIARSTSDRGRSSARSRKSAPTVCIGERIDLVRSLCKREQAYLAENVGRYAMKRNATVLEVACAVASARSARGRKANIGQ
eukprot:IDg8231t1